MHPRIPFQDPRKANIRKKITLAFKVITNSVSTIKGKIYERSLKLELKAHGLACHSTSVLGGHVDGECFTCGNNVSLGVYSILIICDDPAGGAEKGIVDFGDDIYIGDYCNIRAAGGRIKIGSKTLIGNHVTILAANHGFQLGTPILEQPWGNDPLHVEIGYDCWIGANVTLLPGARISDGAIIAAGAVVRSIVPKNEIWGGVPAKKISERSIETPMA